MEEREFRKKMTPEERREQDLHIKDMMRPKKVTTYSKKDPLLVLSKVVYLPEGQWARIENDEKGIRQKVTFPTRTPSTPLKAGEQCESESVVSEARGSITEDKAEATELMRIWTDWKDEKNANLVIEEYVREWVYPHRPQNSNPKKWFEGGKGPAEEQENSNPKINEMVTNAEMVADSAKKHATELKEMYAQGVGKNVDNKQPSQDTTPLLRPRK